MTSSSVNSSLPLVPAKRNRLVLAYVLVPIAALTIGIGCGLAQSATATALAVAAGLTIGTFAVGQTLIGPAPTRIVPLGISPRFTRRLTGSSLMVGREDCCDIVLPLPTVSSHHCRLYSFGRRWYVEDLGSRNGTLVNDRPVLRKRLRVGDKISIGEFDFIVG